MDLIYNDMIPFDSIEFDFSYNKIKKGVSEIQDDFLEELKKK